MGPFLRCEIPKWNLVDVVFGRKRSRTKRGVLCLKKWGEFVRWVGRPRIVATATASVLNTVYVDRVELRSYVIDAEFDFSCMLLGPKTAHL